MPTLVSRKPRCGLPSGDLKVLISHVEAVFLRHRRSWPVSAPPIPSSAPLLFWSWVYELLRIWVTPCLRPYIQP